MTAKQYLDQIRNYERRIERINEEIERLEAVATNTSPSLTGMPHNPSPTTSRLEEAVCKILDKEAELRQERARLDEVLKTATLIISSIEQENYRDVLRKRYLLSEIWEDIAAEMYVSLHYVYKLHNRALKEFEKYLKEDTKGY